MESSQARLNEIFEADRQRSFELAYQSDVMARMQFESDFNALLSTLSDWLGKAKTKEQKEKISGLVRCLMRMDVHAKDKDTRFYRMVSENASVLQENRMLQAKIQQMAKFLHEKKYDDEFELFLKQATQC